jgi:hypothetical protein
MELSKNTAELGKDEQIQLLLRLLTHCKPSVEKHIKIKRRACENAARTHKLHILEFQNAGLQGLKELSQLIDEAVANYGHEAKPEEQS